MNLQEELRDLSGIVLLGYLAVCSLFVFLAAALAWEAVGVEFDSVLGLFLSVCVTAVLLAVPVLIHQRLWIDPGARRGVVLAGLLAVVGGVALVGAFVTVGRLGG